MPAKCTLFLVAPLALLMFGAHSVSAQVSCLDGNGNAVDWWIMYKLPTISGNAQSNNGFGFAYTDPTNSLAITGKSLKDADNALAQTLQQIYQANANYIMWNDETPDGKTTSSQAHAKGVMGFNQNGGFLLRHSTPRFPNLKAKGYQGLPENEKIYGQTYLCASVDIPTLNNLANQYLIAHPLVYDHNVPAQSGMENLSKLAAGKSEKPTQNILQFQTTGGTAMTDFVKSRPCACELWDEIISPQYKQSMNVLSWGRPLEASGCALKNNLQVQNVAHVTWGDLSYKETEEHSKWGVTADNSVVCIADTNRMVSQRKRGGGATCLASPSLANSFAQLVHAVQSC